MAWVNNELFIEKEIPKLNPLSLEYKQYWSEQKKKVYRRLLGWW